MGEIRKNEEQKSFFHKSVTIIWKKILNFAAEFIHHLTEGNQRTLGQDALRPLLFLIPKT